MVDRESELESLLDESNLKRKKKEAEAKASNLSSEEWKSLRYLAKNDLFFLAYSILGYTKLSVNLHGHLCKWIDETKKDWRYRLLLLPRGHYKTTIFTIAESIQIALPDDSGNLPWPYNLGPNCRIALIHESKEQAAKFLSEIQNHFLSNVALMALFPECIPTRAKQTINLTQFELPRTQFWTQKTYEVFGVGAKSQGNHYNVLKPDDLIGEEAYKSQTIMKATNDWIDGLQSFLTSGRAMDKIDFSGTRWAHEDSYQHIMETYGDQIAVYRKAVEIPVKEEVKEKDGTIRVITKKVPIFPEEYPTERLSILRKNRKRFSAQYLNDPDSDTNDFDIDNLKYFYWTGPKKFVAFDSAYQSKLEYNTSELHRLLLIDPAITGKVGITVTGTDQRRKIFVIEAIKDTFTTPQLIKKVTELYMKWQPHAIVVEKVVFSALYETLFLDNFRLKGLRPRIILQPVPSKVHKEDKIRALGEYLDAGVLHINESHTDLIEEFRKFGASNDIHLLDSLWMGVKNWKYTSVIDWEKTPQELYANVLGKFDKVSGYTPI